jgi:hypothetical protein
MWPRNRSEEEHEDDTETDKIGRTVQPMTSSLGLAELSRATPMYDTTLKGINRDGETNAEMLYIESVR